MEIIYCIVDLKVKLNFFNPFQNLNFSIFCFAQVKDNMLNLAFSPRSFDRKPSFLFSASLQHAAQERAVYTVCSALVLQPAEQRAKQPAEQPAVVSANCAPCFVARIVAGSEATLSVSRVLGECFVCFAQYRIIHRVLEMCVGAGA